MATTNQNIAYYYSYDAAGRLTGVTDSNLRNIEYLYDAAGNRISMKTPEGKTIRYEYNANNQLTKITANGKNFTFAYDNLNRRIKRTLPNGTYTTYSYDQNSRLTNITHKNNHNKIIDAFSYTHDNVGNRLTKTEKGIMPHAPDKKINYTYDAIYRLQAAVPEKRGKGKLAEALNKYHTESYTYDAVGNRQSGPHSRDSYSYNAGNELITSTGRIILERDNQYEYDLNGNLIKKTQTIKNKWKLITTYAYDDENRLIEVKIQKGHKIKEISFTYDPLGRRISKTVGRADFEDEDEEEPAEDENDKGKGKDKGKWGKPFQPRTTYYVYDDQNIIAEYDENNKLIASYVHGPNIDEPLSAEIRRDWIYYHADGLGSITALTSHMGNVVQKYDYDSFGNMNLTPKWIKQPFTYTAREFDPETGLYYYRARYYDAKAGRFITKDPIGFYGENINLYVYVNNNAVNMIDPMGLSPSCSPIIKYPSGFNRTSNTIWDNGKWQYSYSHLDGGRYPAFWWTAMCICKRHRTGVTTTITIIEWTTIYLCGDFVCGNYYKSDTSSKTYEKNDLIKEAQQKQIPGGIVFNKPMAERICRKLCSNLNY